MKFSTVFDLSQNRVDHSAEHTVCLLHIFCRCCEEGLLVFTDDGNIWCIALQHYKHHAFVLQVRCHGHVFQNQNQNSFILPM